MLLSIGPIVNVATGAVLFFSAYRDSPRYLIRRNSNVKLNGKIFSGIFHVQHNAKIWFLINYEAAGG